MQVRTVGLDLAKNIFRVHGIPAEGSVAFNRALRRSQVLTFFEKLAPCLVGIEARGTSHYWARELRRLGHQVRLIPPAYVKPYVKRGKSDAADAEAICEAVGRLGRISKMGDRYLRRLLVNGMTARVRAARSRPDRADPWMTSLLASKPVRLVTVATANKTARIIRAVLTRNEPYTPAAA